MGKGKIISGGTAGLYTIEVNYYRERYTAQIAKLNERITVIDAQITSIEAEITTLQAVITALELQIAGYDPVTQKNELKTAMATLVTKQTDMIALRRRLNYVKLQKTSLQLKIKYLQDNMPADPQISAWCADLTEDLSGEVGTIEVPGERGTVLIRPGYSDQAAHSAQRDGQIEPSIAGIPEAVYYNLALFPGWQKWLPTYRFGTILALDNDNDTCSVSLEAALSSAQDLDVNSVTTLTNVPIEYMTCNAAAFDVGDSVIVECTNTITPAVASPSSPGSITTTHKVIGFKDHPKSCKSYAVYLVYGNGSKMAAIVWDCVAGELLMGPVDTTDDDFLAWYNAHQSVGDSLFAALKQDTKAPYKYHPELVDPSPQDPNDIIYYHYIQLGSYWRNVELTESPQEITGILTRFESKQSSYRKTGYFDIQYPGYWDNFVPFDLTPYGPSDDWESDLLAAHPGCIGYIWMVTYIGIEREYTYDFYGPYGLVGSHTGGLSYLSNEYDQNSTENLLKVLYPYDITGKYRYTAAQDGKYNRSTIAMATVIHFQPIKIETLAMGGTEPESDPITDPAEVTNTYKTRVTLVQARAGNIPNGQTWLDIPENTALNEAIADAFDMYYTLNPTSEGIDCTFSVTMLR